MTAIWTIAFLMTFALAAYLFMTTTLAHNAARQVASDTKFGRYIDLCRGYGLELIEARLPDKSGDESFRRFSFTRGGVTRTLRPRATLKVLQALEAGDTDRAFAILRMAQA